MTPEEFLFIPIDAAYDGSAISLDTILEWLASDSFFGYEMLEDATKFHSYKKQVAQKLIDAVLKG